MPVDQVREDSVAKSGQKEAEHKSPPPNSAAEDPVPKQEPTAAPQKQGLDRFLVRKVPPKAEMDSKKAMERHHAGEPYPTVSLERRKAFKQMQWNDASSLVSCMKMRAF